MTKLDSVNFVMTAVGLRAISALETGTASTAADIEREIDRRVKLVCAESWHFNKRVNVVLQPDVNGHILIAQIGDVFTGGYITGISASATPVITTTAHSVLAGAYVTFSGTDCTPALTTNTTTSQPYLVNTVTTNSFTLTTGQVTTTGSGTVGFYTAINPGTILQIAASGRAIDFNRSILMHGDRLYDADANSDVFSGTLTADYTLLYTFDQLPSMVQDYVAALSAATFNKSYGQPARQPGLDNEAVRFKAKARNADAKTPIANTLGTRYVQDMRGNRIPFPGGPFTGEYPRSM